MIKNFKIFLDYALNQGVEVSDKSNLYQCLDLAYEYTLFLNVPKVAIAHLHAFQVFTEPNDVTRQYFELIKNTPEFVPQEGDLCVFGTEVGTSGHISVSNGKGNLKTFESVDQNWAGASKVGVVVHKYGGKNGLLGVLRYKEPKTETTEPSSTGKTYTQEEYDKVRLERDENWNKLQTEVEQRAKDIEDLNRAFGTDAGKPSLLARAKAISDLEKQVEDAQDETKKTQETLDQERLNHQAELQELRDQLIKMTGQHTQELINLSQKHQNETEALEDRVKRAEDAVKQTQTKQNWLDTLLDLFKKD